MGRLGKGLGLLGAAAAVGTAGYQAYNAQGSEQVSANAGLAGAVAGGAVGLFGGPMGAAVGATIGQIAGEAIGRVINEMMEPERVANAVSTGMARSKIEVQSKSPGTDISVKPKRGGAN
jgi:phage tail tape-measure protein